MAGLSTTGIISLGVALVAGRNRVPRPAAGITALVTGTLGSLMASPYKLNASNRDDPAGPTQHYSSTGTWPYGRGHADQSDRVEARAARAHSRSAVTAARR